MFGKFLSLVSLGLFIYLATLVPYMFEVYDLVGTNADNKLTGTQQFAGIIVVGINSGFLIGGMIIALCGVFIPWLPDNGEGTGSTGPR